MQIPAMPEHAALVQVFGGCCDRMAQGTLQCFSDKLVVFCRSLNCSPLSACSVMQQGLVKEEDEKHAGLLTVASKSSFLEKVE